ncbi:hypothetical protein DSO57_1005451 [Entomophthora muscae]|uniref:Uncharacterized protein n=1 Tax=Entomophthora muscae TaxID=34485 RepID=A0ACC2T832_9FUNG|nr:hypothetical protein DSO57_1005451 [Entomophthora muscae]
MSVMSLGPSIVAGGGGWLDCWAHLIMAGDAPRNVCPVRNSNRNFHHHHQGYLRLCGPCPRQHLGLVLAAPDSLAKCVLDVQVRLAAMLGHPALCDISLLQGACGGLWVGWPVSSWVG